jgi:hypothetical protein
MQSVAEILFISISGRLPAQDAIRYLQEKPSALPDEAFFNAIAQTGGAQPRSDGRA